MKFFSHLKTVSRHRHCVMKHCFKAGIPLQGLLHDLSKYSPTEFIPGAKYYQGTRSPNEKERETIGYSAAWMHHKGRNRHHFEYWNDVDPKTKLYTPVKMPVKYVAEMFCDRVAASKIYRGKDYDQKYPLEYLTRGHALNYMHKETGELLSGWLKLLAKEGEDATFAAIRQAVKESKKK